jgi:hypothetical protein
MTLPGSQVRLSSRSLGRFPPNADRDRFADRLDLSMGRDVTGQQDAVLAPGDDLAVLGDDGAEGPTPVVRDRLPRAPEAQVLKARSLCRLRGNPGTPEHPPQVDDLLLVDIVMSRGIERLGLRSQRHRVPAIVLPGDSGHALEE